MCILSRARYLRSIDSRDACDCYKSGYDFYGCLLSISRFEPNVDPDESDDSKFQYFIKF